MNKQVLVSCLLSTLLVGINAADKEYQVDFSNSAGTTSKKPTFASGIEENKDFSWNQGDGIFIVKPRTFATRPILTLEATFTSDQNNYGILALKNFNYINSPETATTTENGGFQIPTKEDAEAKKLTSSKLEIKNSSTTGFKAFVLGADQTGQGSVNLFSGSSLSIEDFTQTILQGSININSGGISKENGYYGYLKASMSIESQKDYSTLSLRSSLNLITNNGMERTQERAKAIFEANVKGNIFIDGYVNIGDKAKMTATAGNVLKISSTISVSAQEMKKITQDTLGNQSIKDEDRVKEKNLILNAPKIELSGALDIGLNARGLETKEEVVNGTNGAIKKTIITQLPSDIGSIAELTLDIGKKQEQSGEKPTDWVETTKAQFIQTGGGRIGIGKNSEMRITTINNKPTDSSKIFDEKDPYAITLSNITIQDQDEKNTTFNFDAQAKIKNGSTNTGSANTGSVDSGSIGEGAGKILFWGKVDLGKNARAKVVAYDGIDLHKDSRFVLGKNSLMWLSVGGKTDFSISNGGSIEAKGGSFVLGEKYEGSGQKNVTLKNTGYIWISDSVRLAKEEDPLYPKTPNQTDQKYLDPLGLFLLGQKNIIDNQGAIVFDGSGNLANLTSKEDRVVRDLEINNSFSGKKGLIEVRGASNSIHSNGGVKILSQNIAIVKKKVQEGEGANQKYSIQEGELLIRSESEDIQSKIVFGKEQADSGRDKVSVTGGTLKIESKAAGVDSYNLRLVDTTLDLSKLSLQEKNGEIVAGGGAFVNRRRLELGGGVKVLLSQKQRAFVNGEYQGKVSQFKEGLPTIQVSGENTFLAQGKHPTNRLGFDNHANIALKSKSTLGIAGDFYHGGSLIFQADAFGVGSVFVEGNATIDMSNHQGGNQSVNPLFAVTHFNFYSLSLDQSYLLLHSKEGIKYLVENVLIDSSDSVGKPSPRQLQSENLKYSKQQQYLKSEIENFLNGEEAYVGNENKLGIFLRGHAFVDTNNIGFFLTRSSAIANIQANSSQTGVIDQYLDILAKSEGQISANKTQEMSSTIASSYPQAMEVLNNALESKNSLELEILKDIGSYNTPGLVAMASAIHTSMQAMADIQKPLLEDLQKMQVVREIAVQNRMMRFSNPYVAEIELAQYIQAVAKNRYAQEDQIQSDIGLNPLSSLYNPQEIENLSYKNSFWTSVISSTAKEPKNTSALYGFNMGYEYMPIYNVLLGLYVAYGYSNFKGEVLKNNAHNIDFTAYTRLYYEDSEFDITLSYMRALNNTKIENSQMKLNQKLDFASNAFDASLKYGYIFGIKKVKGLFIKPQGSLTFYGLSIPQLTGDSHAPIIYEQQMKNGIAFNLGAEIRQYISAYSYLYLLPSFEYDLNNLGDQGKNQAIVYFSGASNKMIYTPQTQPKGLFSIYAGGEGYVSPDFSMNLSAGYKAGLDKEEHNISISAGFKYKF